MDSFGQRLRAARVRAGLNQTQLAEAIGATRQTVNFWETDKRGVRPSFMPKLAQALDVDASDLTPSSRDTSSDAERLDAMEAELRALRATLEANGFTIEDPTVDPAQELEKHAAKHEQQQRDTAGTSSDRRHKAQES